MNCSWPIPTSEVVTAPLVFEHPIDGWAGASCNEVLKTIGVARHEVLRSVEVPSSTVVSLEPGIAGFRSENLSTSSIAEYKRWIGVDDSVAVPIPPSICPALHGSVLATKQDVQNAGFHFLFGDSRPLVGFEEQLNAALGPFHAELYVAGTVRVPAGARLVALRPSVLVFERLRLENDGQLVLHAPCRVHLECLEKRRMH
jgi:hypothetical protein